MDAAALEQLAAEAQADTAAPAAPAPVVAPAPAADPVAETKAVFGTVVAMLSPLLPYLPAIYTDEAVTRLAAAYVPVAQKYGWDLNSLLAGYAAEIALVGTAVPLAMQTAIAHRQWIAARAQDAAKGQGATPAAGNLTANPPPVED